jgi:quinol monooxygenase YgiN
MLERRKAIVDKKLSKEELVDLIDSLNPKIKKSLKNTNYQDRNDLEQEIKLKIIESYEKIAAIDAPNFEEFLAEFLTKQKQ